MKDEEQLQLLPIRSVLFIEREIFGSPVTYHFTVHGGEARYKGVVWDKGARAAIALANWEEGRDWIAEMEHWQADAAQEAQELADLAGEGQP